MKEGLFQAQKFDELYTPVEAIYPLFEHMVSEYAHKDKIFWECTGKNSNITKIFREKGFNIFETHKDDGIDFLKDEPRFHYDIIITNPPYSLKNDFIKRAYELEKPFWFLLPLTTLGSIERGKVFREKGGVTVIVLDRRIDFTGKKNNWFYVAWFIGRPVPAETFLVFAEVKKEET